MGCRSNRNRLLWASLRRSVDMWATCRVVHMSMRRAGLSIALIRHGSGAGRFVAVLALPGCSRSERTPSAEALGGAGAAGLDLSHKHFRTSAGFFGRLPMDP